MKDEQTTESSFPYTIVERIAVLKNKDGYTKELNLMSWGSGKVNYDLRTWLEKDGKRKPLKGIRLQDDELETLRDILNAMKHMPKNSKK